MVHHFITGNYSFYAEANPLLYDVIMEATKSVSWIKAEDEGQDENEKTVYDVWRERAKRSEEKPDKPW